MYRFIFWKTTWLLIDLIDHRKIQEEGLRTYLFTYASYYSTIGLAQLSQMFGLSTVNVSSIVAKMIWQEELSASLDQVTQCVVLHQVEQSRVQQLALQFADKAVNLVEQNERLLEQKNAEQRPEQQQQQKDRRGNKGKILIYAFLIPNSSF
jgi:hypothetical protein